MNLAMQTVLVDLLVVAQVVISLLLVRYCYNGPERLWDRMQPGGVAWCDRRDGRCILDQSAPLDCPYVI